MTYTGWMLSLLLHSRDEAVLIMNPMADFYVLALFPLMGFFFSRRSFSYIKEDSYTQMLLYYRTLPIPESTIMKSRLIQLFIATLFNSLILFTTFFLSLLGLGIKVSLIQMLVFALTWIGYGLGMSGIYIFLELLTKGRVYLLFTLLIMLLSALVAVLVAWLDGNLLRATMDYSMDQGLHSPLMWGTLAGGLLLLSLFSTVTRRGLGRRNLQR